jgi:hypothetical protein
VEALLSNKGLNELLLLAKSEKYTLWEDNIFGISNGIDLGLEEDTIKPSDGKLYWILRLPDIEYPLKKAVLG